MAQWQQQAVGFLLFQDKGKIDKYFIFNFIHLKINKQITDRERERDKESPYRCGYGQGLWLH